MGDFIYVNLNMAYDGTSISGSSLAQTQLFNSSPILSKPSDYVGSIALLSVDSFNNPLIVPLINVGQSDVDQTVYQFALGYNGTYSDPVYVEYVPSAVWTVQPKPPLLAQDLSTMYYYIYEYSTFLDMWNTALAAALTSLNTKHGSTITNVPPKFYFDYTRGVITLQAPMEFYGQTNFAEPELNHIQIYCNDYVSPLINGIAQCTLVSGNTTGCYNCIKLYDQVKNNDGTNYYQGQQSSSELCYWPSCSLVQIVTSMPVQREYSTSPLGTQGLGQTKNQQIALLADFVPDSTDFTSYHSQLIYTQTNPLKMFNLTSDTPLYQCDAQIFWVDPYGRQFPLLLSLGVTCNIKYLFIKKSVYASTIADFKK